MALQESPRGLGRIKRWVIGYTQSDLSIIQNAQHTPDKSETTHLEAHRNMFSRTVEGLLDRWDSEVAEMIGFDGNIREALLVRRDVRKDIGINTRWLDKKIKQYLHPAG